MRRRLAALAVALLALSACTAHPAPGKPPPLATPPAPPAGVATDGRPDVTGPVAVPKTGVLVGAWVRPVAGLGQSDRVLAVHEFEQEIGRKLDIVNTYRRMDQAFPTPSDVAFAEDGATLMVSWATGDTRVIASGHDDGELTAWAARFRSFGHPILLRVRWEMDRPNLRAQMWSGADYVAAWRHIRTLFAAAGVRNVSWVWCPTIGGFADGEAPAFYPGDDEVDWTCADVYAGSVLRPMSELLDPFLRWAAGHPKPIVIGEWGVAQTWGDATRAAWMRGATAVFAANPQIKAVSIFDSPTDGYKLAAGSDPLRAFEQLATADYFNPQRRRVTA